MDAQKLRSRRLEEVPPSRLHRSCGSPVFRLTCLCGKANSGASSWKPAEGSQRRPPETMHSQCTAKSLLNHSPFVNAVTAPLCRWPPASQRKMINAWKALWRPREQHASCIMEQRLHRGALMMREGGVGTGSLCWWRRFGQGWGWEGGHWHLIFRLWWGQP